MVQWSASPDARLDVAGANLEYACFGPEPSAAPTLVLLHEGLGSAALWRDFPQRLAAATGCGVVVFSRAGYGRSSTITLPRPLDYMTREAKDTVGPLLDALGIERAVLLGHSDGASIAAIYAGSVSDMRVRALILMAPHFFNEPMGLDAIRAAKEAYETGDLKARLSKHHDDPDAAFYGWCNAWLDPGNADWDVSDAIDHWRIPVLAIQGREDAYGTLLQLNEIEERIYSPFEQVVLDECGHAPHLEKPQETDAAIAEFCAHLQQFETASVDVKS